MRQAVLANAARLGGRTALAAQGLGEDARHRGLADPARTGEEIGMVDAVAADGVGQGPRHHLLAGDIGEGLRTVLAGDDEVVHAGDSRCRPDGGWEGVSAVGRLKSRPLGAPAPTPAGKAASAGCRHPTFEARRRSAGCRSPGRKVAACSRAETLMASNADAQLIIQLYDLRREAVCRQARAFFVGWTRQRRGGEDGAHRLVARRQRLHPPGDQLLGDGVRLRQHRRGR